MRHPAVLLGSGFLLGVLAALLLSSVRSPGAGQAACPKPPACPAAATAAAPPAACPACPACPEPGRASPPAPPAAAAPAVVRDCDEARADCKGAVLWHDAARPPPLVCRDAPDACAALPNSSSERYLWTLRRSLTGILLATDYADTSTGSRGSGEGRWLALRQFNASMRMRGQDWPAHGMTMGGLLRLNTLHRLLQRVVQRKVPGDFAECGVWRGGASIYARAFLDAHRDAAGERVVWVIDSFAGLPKKRLAGDGPFWSQQVFLRVGLEHVQDNFARHGLLGDNVRFLRGFFADSLRTPESHTLRQRGIALLRFDGDMKSSTLDIFCGLYGALSVGGVWVVDDWSVSECRQTVESFLTAHYITDKPQMSDDGEAAYFVKTQDIQPNPHWCHKQRSKGRLMHRRR